MRMLRMLFCVFYRAKIRMLRWVVGPEAIALTLYKSLFPHIVLEIGGATIGRNVRINRWLSIHECGGSFKGLKIGDDVHIGKFVLLDLTQPLTIGDRVTVAMYSKVLSHQNLGDTRLKQVYPAESGPVTIPDDVVLGAGAIMLYPTRLAPGTLVAAGAVVRGDYDKPCVLMGNPTRIIREITLEGVSPVDAS
jgi:acetyltransferase-like isoleucine patch superfamily enzyme